MSAPVRCPVCLLAVLWTVGRQPAAGVGAVPELGQPVSLRLVVREVTANIQPLINRLSSRIDRLDARLIPRLNSIESRLNALDSKQDRFDAKLDSFDAKQDSFDARLDDLASRMDSEGNRLDARLDEQALQLNSTNNGLHSRLIELASRVDGLAGRNDRLDGVSSRLENVSSLLEGVSSRQEELANLTDRLAQPPPPRDCSGLPAGSRSGIHLLQPSLDCSRPPVKAYCDLESDGGRWTVIQRRANIQPRQNFNRSWSEYREGFGDLEAEFWWGLDNLRKLTGPQHRQYQLRVNLADFDGGRRHASYGRFQVASGANGYRLTISDYTGNAGNSFGSHSGHKFSTYDRGAFGRDCAAVLGGGWWYYGCFSCNLNGLYLSGQHDRIGGVIWYHWRGNNYSLKETEMKIRPVDTD